MSVKKWVHFNKVNDTEKSNIISIRFLKCNKELKFDMIGRNGRKQWWRLRNKGIPDRIVGVIDGHKSIDAFIRNYGYIGENNCVSWKEGEYGIGKLHRAEEVPIEPKLQAITGVPQRAINSGLCWYCAMCFCMFFSDQMSELLHSKLPLEMRKFCKTILSNPADAEAFRRLLYSKYSVGDKPDQNPELDGQNGFGQFCIILAKLNIPCTGASSGVTQSLLDFGGPTHRIRMEVTTTGRLQFFNGDTCILNVQRSRDHTVTFSELDTLNTYLNGYLNGMEGEAACPLKAKLFFLSMLGLKAGTDATFVFNSRLPRNTRGRAVKQAVQELSEMLPLIREHLNACTERFLLGRT